MSFLQPPGEVSVELEVWGGVGLSAGERGCLMNEEEVSSAAGAGHGGQEAGDDDQVPGNDD